VRIGAETAREFGFIETLIPEVGTGIELYVTVARIVFRRQRPKPLVRPPMRLATQL